MNNKTKSKKRIALVLMVIFIILIAFMIYYVNDYYHSEEIVETYLTSNEEVKIVDIDEGLFFDGAGEEDAVIFYPGAKVEYTAYAPMMKMLAEEGIDCFLLKMPCNLAILGVNKADEIIENYDYENIYLAGHSLGGAMAASYTAEKLEKIKGLILLAAYPTKELYPSNLAVMSVYGSEDNVVNHEKMESGKSYMPEAFTEICIEGGNHAGFGAYGEQEGDKSANISQEEQWKQTTESILQFLK